MLFHLLLLTQITNVLKNIKNNNSCSFDDLFFHISQTYQNQIETIQKLESEISDLKNLHEIQKQFLDVEKFHTFQEDEKKI